MKKILLLCVLVIGMGWPLLAQEQYIPARPEHFTPIIDSANVLSTEQETALTTKIKRFEDSTGTQIAVVLIPSLKGYTVEGYAFEWFKKWQYGQSKNNNGVLLFAAIDDHKVHIEVGYGLEGAIPDAYAKRIIENQIKPNFKNTDYYQGANEAVDKLALLASGEPYEKEDTEPVEWYWYALVVALPIGFVVFVVFVILLIIKWIRGNKKAGTTLTSKGDQKKYITSAKKKSKGTNSSATSYSDYSDKYSDYSDSYSDYSDYSDSSGGSSGGGGASGSW